MVLCRRMLPAVSAVLLLTGCGGLGGDTMIVYFKQDGSRARPEQVVPVLQPVERRAPSQESMAVAVVRALLDGPSAAERKRGFRPPVHARVRQLSVHVRDGTAVVDYSGEAIRDFYAEAAVVFSLTALPGIERVSLRHDGTPCCAMDHQGNTIDPLTRRLYRGWPGEPCDLRTYAGAVPCRR